MSEFDLSDTFSRFMPQAWADQGIVRHASLKVSARSRVVTSVRTAVVLAAAIVGTSEFVTTAEAKSTAATTWALEAITKHGVDEIVAPDWGAVINFISRQPVVPETEEPESYF